MHIEFWAYSGGKGGLKPSRTKITVDKPTGLLSDLLAADFKRWLLWIANQFNFGISRGPFGRNCW